MCYIYTYIHIKWNHISKYVSIYILSLYSYSFNHVHCKKKKVKALKNIVSILSVATTHRNSSKNLVEVSNCELICQVPFLIMKTHRSKLEARPTHTSQRSNYSLLMKTLPFSFPLSCLVSSSSSNGRPR